MWVKEELFWQKASAVLFETRKVQLAMAVARVKAHQDQEDGVLYFGCYMISLPLCRFRPAIGWRALRVALPEPFNAITCKFH